LNLSIFKYVKSSAFSSIITKDSKQQEGNVKSNNDLCETVSHIKFSYLFMVF